MTRHNMTGSEFSLLGRLIEKELGIYFAKEKKYFLETKLKHLLSEMKCHGYLDLYHKAAGDLTGAAITAVAEAITTNETSWFRDGGPFEALEKSVFPDLIKSARHAGRNKLRVWSAACSTGQEPYSIAITWLDTIAASNTHNPPGMEIIATDVSKAALSTARAGRYDLSSIGRGMPGEILERCFDHSGKEYEVKREVKKLVHFRHFNLKHPFRELGHFDVVFSRNAAIYFSGHFRDELMKKTAGIVRPGGFLFLGSSESAAGYKDIFTLHHAHGTVFYRKI